MIVDRDPRPPVRFLLQQNRPERPPLLLLLRRQELTRGAMSEAEAYADFTFNRLILRHEAEALGIKPTRDEIVTLVRTLRPFRGEAGVST